MEPDATLFGPLIETLESNARTSIQLAKLKLVNGISTTLSSLILQLAILCVLILAFLMLMLGCAIWLGYVLGRMWYGFFIIAGFFFLIGLILHLFCSKQVKIIVRNNLIKILNVE